MLVVGLVSSAGTAVHLEAGACLFALAVAVDDARVAVVGHRAVAGYVLTAVCPLPVGVQPEKVVEDLDAVSASTAQAEHAAKTFGSDERLCK